jgi:hypothetical protein
MLITRVLSILYCTVRVVSLCNYAYHICVYIIVRVLLLCHMFVLWAEQKIMGKPNHDQHVVQDMYIVILVCFWPMVLKHVFES